MDSLQHVDIGIAYLAGFFDGEGCISMSRDKRGYVARQLKIVGVDPSPLERFRSRFGGTISLRKTRQSERHSYATALTLGKREGQEALRAMLPLLTVKREQAEAFLIDDPGASFQAWEKAKGRTFVPSTPD